MTKTIFCHSLDDIEEAMEAELNDNIVCDYPYLHDWYCCRCGSIQNKETARFFPYLRSVLDKHNAHCPHCAESVK